MTPLDFILPVLAVGILSWLGVGSLFLGFPTVERLKEHRDKIPLGWISRTPIYVGLLVFLVCDVLFNWIWGTVIFREFPREGVFTNRLKRHWRGKSDKQRRRAEPWVLLVNMIDPGHVTRLPE